MSDGKAAQSSRFIVNFKGANSERFAPKLLKFYRFWGKAFPLFYFVKVRI
jgi:hypothetical protein